MENYGVITRGSDYPAGGRRGRVRLTDSEGWVNSEDSWTWKLLISRKREGGTPDLSITADEASIASSVLSIWFKAAATATIEAALPSLGEYAVDLQSADGSGVVSIWRIVEGTVEVRDRAGE